MSLKEVSSCKGSICGSVRGQLFLDCSFCFFICHPFEDNRSLLSCAYRHKCTPASQGNFDLSVEVIFVMHKLFYAGSATKLELACLCGFRNVAHC